MGLLTGLLTFPVAPLRGVAAVAEQVRREAERVYFDPATIRADLEEVDALRQAGELSEDEATAREEQLIERLMTGRHMEVERRG